MPAGTADIRSAPMLGDLTSRSWIVAKGVLFAVIVLMSGVGVMLHDDRRFRLVFLLLCLWAGCRFYYFLFHVLERYVGVAGRYAGVFDLCRRLWRRARGKSER